MKVYAVPKYLFNAELAKIVARAIVLRLKGIQDKKRKAEEAWKEYIKIVTPHEDRFRRILKKLFKAQEQEVLRNMRRSSKSLVITKDKINTWLFDEKEWKEKFGQAEEDFLAGLATEVGNQTVESLPVVGMMFDVNNPNLRKRMDKRVGEFKGVVDTTTRKIRDSLTVGIDAGESIDELADRVINVFKDASYNRAEMIARTETIWGSNAATESTYMQSGVVEGKEWQVALDGRLCEFCMHMYEHYGPSKGGLGLGERFFEQGDSLQVGEGESRSELVFNYEPIEHPPLHPRCLIDWQTPIYTSKGWVPIGKVKKDDLVLTHKGRFKKVTHVIRTPKQITEVVRIGLEDKQHQRSSSTLTANHPVLLNGKWVKIGNVRIGDMIQFLARRCKECGKLIPYYNKYCSLSCGNRATAKEQWKDPEHRENMSRKAREQMLREYTDGVRDRYEITKKANEKTRELARKGLLSLQNFDSKVRRRIRWKYMHNKEARRRSSERMRKNNPSRIPEIRARMTESYKRTLKEHPERHPNRIMAQKGFISSLEGRFKEVLDRIGVKYEHQYPILNYFVDFAIPELRIAIEVDGKYWHQDKERDLRRQSEIEAEGWLVIRYDEDMINECLEEVENEVNRLVSNHKGEYVFLPMEVKSIRKWELKKPRMLYNLEVEGDESYVAKGFVVHNCRCSLVPVIKEGYSEENPMVHFTPAKTIKEAEKFHRKFFMGMPKIASNIKREVSKARYLEFLNTVNEEMVKLSKHKVFSKRLPRLHIGDGGRIKIGSLEQYKWAGQCWMVPNITECKVEIAYRWKIYEKDPAILGKKSTYSVSGWDLRSVLRHEMGHAVHANSWYHYMDEEDSALVAALRRVLRTVTPKVRKKIEDYISPYALKNDREFFAECFTIYTHPKYKPGSIDKTLGIKIEKYIKFALEREPGWRKTYAASTN